MLKKDTISAIATAFGNAAVAVIRISGPKSLKILRAVFLSSQKEILPRKMYFGKIVSKNKTIDEVMICYFKAPRSFTGEDSVEIYAHGGYINAQKILNLVLLNGARIAEPGEFTKRAFLSGKIDLTQAEAVADIVYATSSKAQSIAQNQLEGFLGSKIKKVLSGVMDVYSHLVTQIDFPEEDVKEISSSQILKKIKKLKEIIQDLLLSADKGSVYKNGIKVAIVGLPNAGKSSLLNALVKDKKAIVTDIPGTTRDILESSIELNGVLFRIFDTAGITDTENKVEKEGIKRSFGSIRSSDIILFVVEKYKDVNKFLMHIKKDLHKILIKKTVFLIKNKQDKFKDKKVIVPSFVKKDCQISAQKNKGIKEVERMLLSQVSIDESSENIFITSIRQKELLKKTLKSIGSVEKLVLLGESEDKILAELEDSRDSLKETLGENITDDITKKVFSRFCVGK